MNNFRLKLLTSIWAIVLIMGMRGHAQSPLFSYEKYVKSGDTLNYRLLLPDYNPSNRYPLVIFLHGSGERGDDNEAQLKWGVMNFASDQQLKTLPAIVIAPQCPPNERWANLSEDQSTVLPGATRPMELTLALIDQAIKSLPVDTSRIYITGLSMGGAGTFAALAERPKLFAAALPVCGRNNVAMAKSIAHIPMWMLHGAQDSVVSAEYSRKMEEALSNQGAQPGLTIYPQVGHFAWVAAYSDPMVMAWLFRQHK